MLGPSVSARRRVSQKQTVKGGPAERCALAESHRRNEETEAAAAGRRTELGDAIRGGPHAHL